MTEASIVKTLHRMPAVRHHGLHMSACMVTWMAIDRESLTCASLLPEQNMRHAASLLAA
jgi:hypothetical protein